MQDGKKRKRLENSKTKVVKKEHVFKTEAKNEQLFKPKVELEIGMHFAVAAEPRTGRNVHKWNNRTRDHFVDLVKQITPNFEVSLSEDDVDFGSAGSAHGNDVESNVSDDDAKSQGADSAADMDKFYDLCRKLKEKATRGVSHKMRPSRDKQEERRPWARLSHGQAEDEIAWDTASLPSHWEPSRSASRHRRVDRSCGKVRKRFEKRRGKCGQSAEAIRRNFSANAEKVRARLRSEKQMRRDSMQSRRSIQD